MFCVRKKNPATSLITEIRTCNYTKKKKKQREEKTPPNGAGTSVHLLHRHSYYESQDMNMLMMNYNIKISSRHCSSAFSYVRLINALNTKKHSNARRRQVPCNCKRIKMMTCLFSFRFFEIIQKCPNETVVRLLWN